MYNKIFTKILDSSIWLESDSTRIVWLTMLASMNQDGFCQFASVGNLAHRAIVPREAAEAAVKVLESPDKDSSDPDNEGRRIERVDGGWMVLNSLKYRDIVTAEEGRRKTRERVKRFREGQNVTPCNDNVTSCNVLVTQSEAISDTEAFNPPTPLDKKLEPSANGYHKIDSYMAAQAFAELAGFNGNQNLYLAKQAMETWHRRKPALPMEQGPQWVMGLWREYDAMEIHGKVSMKTFLGELGRFMDSDSWRKKPKQAFVPQIDWQGGHVGEDGCYVNKHGKRIPGFICPPKPKEMAGD